MGSLIQIFGCITSCYLLPRCNLSHHEELQTGGVQAAVTLHCCLWLMRMADYSVKDCHSHFVSA